MVGGGVVGQRILTKAALGETPDCAWPGLGPGQLSKHGTLTIPFTNPAFPGMTYTRGERDLLETTHFRDVYAEVLAQVFDLDGAAIKRVLLSAETGDYEPTPLPDNGLFGNAVYS